jgi:two-component system sensor histidine kinase KdpD
MFVVSLVIGTLVLRLREQREAALALERRMSELNATARDLSTAVDLPDVAAATCRGAAKALSAEAVWFDVSEGNVVNALVSEPASSDVGAALAVDRVHHSNDARRAASNAEREALRSQLLSSVSHDLRTPLATITGAATALCEGPDLDPDTKGELTQSIVDEAERLERLVANLLDMTRLEQGAVVPKREWVPAEEVVGSALTRLDRVLVGRPVRTKLEPDLPLLSVDPVLLEQLFVNLLENAIKYTPPGSELSIAASAAGENVQFDVADRGPGIDAGQEERIFERFHRGDAPGVRGSGLGLAIARAIARVHGGQLTAATRDGGGAVFRLVLPLSPGAPTMLGIDGAAAPGTPA